MGWWRHAEKVFVIKGHKFEKSIAPIAQIQKMIHCITQNHESGLARMHEERADVRELMYKRYSRRGRKCFKLLVERKG